MDHEVKAKERLTTLVDSEDFKRLQLHEQVYLVLTKYPLCGPDGRLFTIGSASAVGLAEIITQVFKKGGQ